LDIVALTSLNEGTPLSLIEAMANERPVIATAVGGVVDLLGQKTSSADGFHICERGVLVEEKDAATFAKGLDLLITDESLRHEIAARGREFVEKNYSKERLLRDVASLYQQMLSEARP
ncbi:MAG TPA: glycosyltransferase family 4 protein, partial [Pyrinomonadaceae bacterium]|nr:glycosyltransferase family 4 protein [Pyrinomonadaceae bacterium]